MKGQRIKQFKAHNFMGTSEIEVNFNGRSAILRGENGAGKSTILQGILAALQYRASNVPYPVKMGQDGASVYVETEDFLVTRAYVKGEKSSVLRLIDKARNEDYNKPQTRLDSMINVVTIKPDKFYWANDKEQLEILRQIIDPEHKIDKVEDDLILKMNGRKEAKKEYDRLKKICDEMASDISYEGKELKDHTTLLANYEKAKDLLDKRVNNEKRITAIREEIARLKKEMLEIEADMPIGTEDELRADTVNNKAELDSAEVYNNGVRAYQAKDKALAEVTSAGFKVDQYEEDVKSLRDKIQQMITSSNIPIEGLSFDESQVLMNGVPLKQLSEGQQFEVSLHLSTALAIEDGFRVAIFERGSQLDSTKQRKAFEHFEANNMQLLMEVVGDEKEVVIEIIEETGGIEDSGLQTTEI